MDGPDLYAEIGDDPVPDGLSDAPHPEELFKRWRLQKQETCRLIETIQKLADENKRILKERDEFEEECVTLRKRNNVYKKNAKMIFSVCRVELSKRDRRIETLEHRINSYGIVDGNSYSVAANSNEDDFSTQISLNLDTELRYTGILSELNHELMVLKNKNSREEANSTNHNAQSNRDHPFDCRPFRGPKTPPTPSCNKPSIARVRASSAERYERKRDNRNSDVYSVSQSKYRRYDNSDDSKDTYRKLNGHVDDQHEFYESRDRRPNRRDNDYALDQSHLERNYNRYREMGPKDGYTNRSDSRLYSRGDRIPDRDYGYDGERYHDRNDRGFNGERFHEKSRGYESGQYRTEFSRSYEHPGSDSGAREDRDPRYMNGIRRNRGSIEDKDEFGERRDSIRDVVNNRDRYSDRGYYDDDGRSYAGSHRSQSSRRLHEDDVSEMRPKLHESADNYLAEERERLRCRNSREKSSRDRQHCGSDNCRPVHTYPSKRPDKHMSHVAEKEIEKSVGHAHDRRLYKKLDAEMGNRGNIAEHSHSGVSPLSHRHIKEPKSAERHHTPYLNGTVDLPNITSSNSSECLHELRARDKQTLQSAGNEMNQRNVRTSSSPNVSPSSAVKSGLCSKATPKSHIINPMATGSAAGTKESAEQDNQESNEQPILDAITSTPSPQSKLKPDVNTDPETRNKMKKVRDRKPILFTKVKESQKPEELDSIQTSLDASFMRDLNNYTAKEIFQRCSKKEGLPREDFIVSEGIRIQRKEAEEVEADNFVLGSEYKKKSEDSDIPTDSTYTKRMREKLEMEELKASLPKPIGNRLPSPDCPTPSEPGNDEQDNQQNVSEEVGKSDKTSTLPLDKEVEKPETPVDDVRSPICYDDADEEIPSNSVNEENPSNSADEENPSNSADEENPSNSADEENPSNSADGEKPSNSVIQEPLSTCLSDSKRPTDVKDKPDEAEENDGIDVSETKELKEIMEDHLPCVEHEEIVVNDSVNTETPDEEEKKDTNADISTSQEVVEEPLPADSIEEHHSETSHESCLSNGEGSVYEDETVDPSPQKDAEVLLEWDFDDDLHLEEVDTTNVTLEDHSDGEASTGPQKTIADDEEGEMEEGEILDDSENESVPGAEGTKVKVKQKSKAKKGKRKDKSKKQKVKKVKQEAGGHKVRTSKTKTSQKTVVTGGGKCQTAKTRSRSRHPHDETAFRLTHRLAGNTDLSHSSRSETVRQRHTADKYEPLSHIEQRMPSEAARRQRSGVKAAGVARREDDKPINGRKKELPKGVSGSYRGRSPPLHRNNCMPTKSFRARRHEVVDRHRARR